VHSLVREIGRRYKGTPGRTWRRASAASSVRCEAPKGQTFPIGLLKEEDRRQIHLATLKPQLLRARAQDRMTFVDSMNLLPALRRVARREPAGASIRMRRD
jgi:hypothetical protein